MSTFVTVIPHPPSCFLLLLLWSASTREKGALVPWWLAENGLLTRYGGGNTDSRKWKMSSGPTSTGP